MSRLKPFRSGICAALCLLGVGVTSSVSATLIDHGTFFTDTTSGLDWLNDTPLAGQSFNSVLAGAGGFTSSGWRFATGVELKTLVGAYVGLGALNSSGTSETFINLDANALTTAASLIGLLGVNVAVGNPPDPRGTSQSTFTNTTHISTQGWYDDGTGGAKVGVFSLAMFSTPDAFVRTEVVPDFLPANDFHGSNVSAILVRQTVTPAPEPTTLALLGLGLVGLGFNRRRHAGTPGAQRWAAVR